MLIVTEFSLLSIYLLPLNSSSVKSSASSQMKRPKSSPSSETSSASQPQANLNESSQNLCIKFCSETNP